MEPNTADDSRRPCCRGHRPGPCRRPASTTRSPASCARSSSSACSSSRTPTARTSRTSATPTTARRAPGRRESQVLLKNTGSALPLAADAKSTSPAATPTTWATSPAAGPSPGRAFSGNSGHQTGTTILEGIRRGRAARHGDLQRRRLGTRPPAATSASWWSARRPYAEGFGDVGGPQWAYDPRTKRPARAEVAEAAAAGPRHRRQGLRGAADLRRARRLRPAADRHRPARRDRRARRVVAARHRGRRRRRRAVRQAALHRPAARDVAAAVAPGPDQRR